MNTEWLKDDNTKRVAGTVAGTILGGLIGSGRGKGALLLGALMGGGSGYAIGDLLADKSKIRTLLYGDKPSTEYKPIVIEKIVEKEVPASNRNISMIPTADQVEKQLDDYIKKSSKGKWIGGVFGTFAPSVLLNNMYANELRIKKDLVRQQFSPEYSSYSIDPKTNIKTYTMTPESAKKLAKQLSKIKIGLGRKLKIGIPTSLAGSFIGVALGNYIDKLSQSIPTD